MQMIMQTMPLLPAVGESVKGATTGGKTLPGTFALLLGGRMESVSPLNPAKIDLLAETNPEGALAPGGSENPLSTSAGEEKREAVVSEWEVPVLFEGGTELARAQFPAVPEGEAPEMPPAVVGGEENEIQHPVASEPVPANPVSPEGNPLLQAVVHSPREPQRGAEGAPAQNRNLGEGADLSAQWPASAREGETVLPHSAGNTDEAPAERPAGLVERQFSPLLEKGGEAPRRGDLSRPVSESRPALHPAATETPASPQAAVETVAKNSSSSGENSLPPAASAAMEGAPSSASHQGVHQIHPAGAPPAPPQEQPQATAPAVQLPSGQSVPEGRIVEQVVGRLAVGPEGEGGALTLKLNPKELGEVRVELVVEKDRVKAQIIAQNQQVQEVLERHLPRLRTALEHQGLRLDTLQVSVDSHGDGGAGRGFFQEHQRPSAPVRFAYRGEGDSRREADPTPHPVPREGRGINLRI